MAEQTPLYMDISNVYSGDELGLPWRDIMGEGIVGTGDLAVTAGTGNSVNVAAGACWVTGDTNPALQPTYRCYNDAVVNKGINPDPSNPRYVQVIAQITDQGFAGSGRNWQVVATHGTPAASPAVPATPASALPLANILVPTNAASSAAYTITDLRSRASIGGGQASVGGGGGELGYAQRTTVLAVTATSAPTAQTVVTAPAITVDGATAIIVQFRAPNCQTPAVANGQLLLDLFDGSTDLGILAQLVDPAAAIFGAPMAGDVKLTPTSGSHTYSIRAWVTSGSGQVSAGAGGAALLLPAYIRVIRA